MEHLPPIPSPPGHWWREFCYRGVPILAFLLAVGGIVVLWNRQGSGRMITGMGEGVRTTVTSPHAGTVLELLVEPYATVRQGDPIAVFKPFDPRADLDLLRSQMELARLRATPTLAEESAISLERLRIELSQTRSELAVARVRLTRAERDLARSASLHQEKLISTEFYDLALSLRDTYLAEVEARSNAVIQAESRLEVLQGMGPGATHGLTEELLSQFESLNNDIAGNWEPVTLQAPIDGSVGAILHQPGEFVVEGEPLVTVQALRAERIVGYLRQPFAFEPETGQSVIVRQRTTGRGRFVSQVLRVGSQFEFITNSLAIIRDGVLVDSGLPIVVEIPSHVHIRPGEVVDLFVQSTQHRDIL